MADPKRGEGAPPSRVHVEEKRTNWLAWLALAAGLLALLFSLSRCDRDENVAQMPATVPTVAPSASPVTAMPAGVSGVGPYLAGTEAVPRTFIFERLKFATAKSDIQLAERDEVLAVAAAMKQYPGARIRVIGYADARGSDPANAQLGAARANSVKAALVANGIADNRIETATGGETNPVDSNVTAAGQAENRRTEVIVLQR